MQMWRNLNLKLKKNKKLYDIVVKILMMSCMQIKYVFSYKKNESESQCLTVLYVCVTEC